MTPMLALGVGALFCIVRAGFDFAARRIWWSVAGLIVALAFVTVPVPTHAVKVDLPVAGAWQ